MTAPLLKDVFTIPEHTGVEDYVLRLTDATSGRGIDEALSEYVVTPEIRRAFDTALAVIEESMTSGLNRGAFLVGSFGSGKSHFMAVLHALLKHNPHARAISELQGPIAAHDPALQGKKFLPLAFHFLGAESIEQALFTGYVDQVQQLHPDAALPAVYRTEALLNDAEGFREKLGDEHFLDGLGGRSGKDDGDAWGALLESETWDLDRYEAARAAAPSSQERRDLVQALIENYFPSYTRMGEFVDLDTGLKAISEHAKRLGYDAVVLFLDELVLWLAFEMQDRNTFGREAQKLTKLVEGQYGRLQVPIISFIARQMDLKQWFRDSGSSGQEQKALDDAFSHQSGRFTEIALGDDNLAYVAARRLLQPKNDQAKAAIAAAFDQVDRTEGVWDVLLDGVNTDERHRGADENLFRLTYPFSPALVATLRSLSGLMQRDRTALKVMQQILVDRRDTMTIDELIPVGDAYSYVVDGSDGSVLDSQAQATFRSARGLYNDKLRGVLLSNLELSESDLTSEADNPKVKTFRKDERLAHTLLLSAVAPGVPALKALTASRLASLNHGTIKSPLPGGDAGLAAAKVRTWAGKVPEIKVGGTDRDPVFSVSLSNVDYESIVERAKSEDNPGRQRDLLRELFLEAAQITVSADTMDGSMPVSTVWRASRRTVDIVFGNVREAQDIPEDRFRARPGTWRLIIDLPFDEVGHTSQEDIARVEALMSRDFHQHTLIWLPHFLSKTTLLDLRRLVVLRWLLNGDEHWKQYSDHLSETDRTQSKVILEGQRATLHDDLLSAITQAYGAAAPSDLIARDGVSQVLWSLDAGHQPQTPGGPTLDKAFQQVIGSAWDSIYPDHPTFPPSDEPLRLVELQAVVEHVTRAVAHPEHRVPLQGSHIAAVRRIANALHVGRASETHYLASTGDFSTWTGPITRGLSGRGIGLTDPVPVRDLREILAGMAISAGLERPVSDVVVLCWAALQQRAWFKYGSPVPEPKPGAIDDAMELRTQDMPTEDEWQAALERAGALFGVSSTKYLNAQNVTELAGTLADKVSAFVEPVRALEQAVMDANAKRHLGDTPRLVLAKQMRGLIDGLRPLSGLPLLRTLADASYDAADEAAARSLSTAGDVARSLRGYAWEHLSPLTGASRGSDSRAAEAKQILHEFDEALVGLEFSKPIQGAIATLESKIWEWMAQGSAPDPEPQPEPRRAQRSGRRTVTWRGGSSLREIADQISDEVDDGQQVEISWREIP